MNNNFKLQLLFIILSKNISVFMEEENEEKTKKKTTTKLKKEKPIMGRPKKDIDWGVFKKYCESGCTQEEICDFFSVSADTLQRRIKEQFGEEATFAEFYKKNSANIKMSIRRVQIRLAMEGSVPMAIFLGKQLLGQSDKIDQTNPQGNNKIEIVITETEKPMVVIKNNDE